MFVIFTKNNNNSYHYRVHVFSLLPQKFKGYDKCAHMSQIMESRSIRVMNSETVFTDSCRVPAIENGSFTDLDGKNLRFERRISTGQVIFTQCERSGSILIDTIICEEGKWNSPGPYCARKCKNGFGCRY